MTDIADIADREQEWLKAEALQQGRIKEREGPKRCNLCGALNDRAKLGYARCSDCMNTNQE